MLVVTRLNGEKMVINLDLIETLESTPDTVVTLTTGKKFVVREGVDKIMSEAIKFKRLTYNNIKK